ncbi:hypothetical protein CHUAL_005458 [Chamberlinius hualienensis]
MLLITPSLLVTLAIQFLIVGSQECSEEDMTFELVTGYVHTAPSDTIDNRPGTLFLLDCLQACRNNQSCLSVNFETGLCVLFNSNANSASTPGLTLSQFPVFTLYGQKTCIRGSRKCQRRGWAFERVSGYQLNGVTKKRQRVATRQACEELCLQETEFLCRSANYDAESGECSLNDMDRFTLSSLRPFQRISNPTNGTSNSTGVEYLENNCIDDSLKMCDFLKVDGRILKTVDAVYQNVSSLEACRQRCLSDVLQCKTFDWSVTGDNVCRLSHHSTMTLAHIQDPYLDSADTTTYELGSCYNITVQCRATDMVAKVKTNKVFNGKIYAKSKPTSCVNDIENSLDFDLAMPYNDVNCNVKREAAGLFTNDIVLQHHDMVVTNLDLGMSVHCQYDLKNKSIGNSANLSVQGDIDQTGSERENVSSPNVLMKIADKDGDDIMAASVGDPLSLRFEIVDKNSPYEIFVRELVAMDGLDNEILLIDSLGCPTDSTIMGPLTKVEGNGKSLSAIFDAFKFPSSEVVQFKALVTPCLPACEPIECDMQLADGSFQQVVSNGRKRRDNRNDVMSADDPTKVVVVQSIRIKDTFSKRTGRKLSTDERTFNDSVRISKNPGFVEKSYRSGICLDMANAVIGSSVFLIIQIIFLITLACICKHRKNRSTIAKGKNKWSSQSGDTIYANFSRT